MVVPVNLGPHATALPGPPTSHEASKSATHPSRTPGQRSSQRSSARPSRTPRSISISSQSSLQNNFVTSFAPDDGEKTEEEEQQRFEDWARAQGLQFEGRPWQEAPEPRM